MCLCVRVCALEDWRRRGDESKGGGDRKLIMNSVVSQLTDWGTQSGRCFPALAADLCGLLVYCVFLTASNRRLCACIDEDGR